SIREGYLSVRPAALPSLRLAVPAWTCGRTPARSRGAPPLRFWPPFPHGARADSSHLRGQLTVAPDNEYFPEPRWHRAGKEELESGRRRFQVFCRQTFR